MRFDLFSLFPGYFAGPFGSSILRRAASAGLIEFGLHDVRNWAEGRHRVCDDAPYGGGAGMVMKAEPVAAALEDVLHYKAGTDSPPCPVILMSPQGRRFDHELALELSRQPRLALLCGHYEGIDERAVSLLVTDEISIGDFVLTGGEPAAAAIVDAVARLVPGVLGNESSAGGDTFAAGLLEGPQYTRPAEWRGMTVPEVLLSGHHGEVAKWRRRQALLHTRQRRPDLLSRLIDDNELTAADLLLLEQSEDGK